MNATPAQYAQLDAWIDAHFDEQVKFLQALVQVPTDTPPGNNAPHAERTAELLRTFGYEAEKHAVPEAEVKAYGLESITNLIVRRRYSESGTGKTIALNAHGDVVPPGEGWTHDPYGGEIDKGAMYGRATAVSKSDFSTFTFATRALESLGIPLKGGVELHFTYDEEFGGEMGPGWLLAKGLTKPDLMIAAGFSYQVVTAHNGCLQMEVTVHGEMAHAAIPDTGTDALQGAVHILNALHALNADYKKISSRVEGITHPYLNVGQISGGTNTNVMPGKVVFKLDRRMIPEENPAEVEAAIRQTIEDAAKTFNPPRGGRQLKVDIRRILLANAMVPLAGNQPLVDAIQKHGSEVFGEPIPAVGTPLYTDVRLYVERGIPGVIYGAGPRTVRESNAKRSDEHVQLEDLRRATKVVARTLLDLLT
jgi:succinyl-diaminopimelate desuccinylase